MGYIGIDGMEKSGNEKAAARDTTTKHAKLHGIGYGELENVATSSFMFKRRL